MFLVLTAENRRRCKVNGECFNLIKGCAHPKLITFIDIICFSFDNRKSASLLNNGGNAYKVAVHPKLITFIDNKVGESCTYTPKWLKET